MFVTRSSTVGSKHHGETCFIPDAQLFIAFAGGTPLVDPSALGDAMGPGVALHQRKPVTAPSRRHGSQGLDFFFVRSSLPALSWPGSCWCVRRPSIFAIHPSIPWRRFVLAPNLARLGGRRLGWAGLSWAAGATLPWRRGGGSTDAANGRSDGSWGSLADADADADVKARIWPPKRGLARTRESNHPAKAVLRLVRLARRGHRGIRLCIVRG